MTYTYYLKIFGQKEKQEIVEKLKEQFGITNIPGIITSKSSEKLFLFQGHLKESQIKILSENFPIERIGIYFAKFIDGKIKLSIEGTQILKSQIKKNIFELNDSQAEQWMKGQELLVEYLDPPQKRVGGWAPSKEKFKSHFLAMKYKDEFLGCGKASELKISNFIPKSRRLKERTK